jgi:hypothetical protein
VGDNWCEACLPELVGVPSKFRLLFQLLSFIPAHKKKSEMETTQHKERDAIYSSPHQALSGALSGPDFAALWNSVVLPQGLTLCCVVK